MSVVRRLVKVPQGPLPNRTFLSRLGSTLSGAAQRARGFISSIIPAASNAIQSLIGRFRGTGIRKHKRRGGGLISP